MLCPEVLERLSPFMDDELDPVTSRQIAEHLASCPACTAALVRQRQLSASLRAGVEYHRAQDLLRARLARATQAADGRDAARPRTAAPASRWLGAVAAVAAAVAVAWLGVTLPADRARDAIAREAVASHVRSLMVGHLMDVASTDQHTVKPWFNGKLDFSPPVTDFAAAGYPLVGGRLDYVADRAVAALVYRRHQHVINVFVWPAAGAPDAIAAPATMRGFQVIRATHAHMAFWIVSDLNAGELGAFARMIAAG